MHHSNPSSLSKDTTVKSGTSRKVQRFSDIFCTYARVVLRSFVFLTSNLHVLDAILMLIISKRVTFRNLVLQYIFLFSSAD